MATAQEIVNFDKIERDAELLTELSEARKELQSILDKVYPGYTVVLQAPANPEEVLHRSLLKGSEFRDMTGIDQILAVLKAEGQTTSLKKIYEKLQERGASMSMSTLMSILSTNKKGCFVNVSRGFWAAK